MTSPPVVHEASAVEARGLRSLAAGAGLPLTGLDDAWKTWVATSSGDVLGGVALERYETPTRPVFLLRSLVVDDVRRGEGVGASLVREALRAADLDAGAPASVALLTETADGYFPRLGFHAVSRADMPAALAASPELTGACPDTARAFLRD
jgi:amino-acid N-acetyltransferase